MEKFENKIITGHIEAVLPRLSRSISMFQRKYKKVKVGITGRNPQHRFNEHKKDGWERMIVKYKSKSVRYCNMIEDFFIYHNPTLKNSWIGTSNLSNEDQYNYFYIIVSEKKT